MSDDAARASDPALRRRVVDLYRDEMMGLGGIGGALRLSVYWVRRILDEEGIAMRSRAEQSGIAAARSMGVELGRPRVLRAWPASAPPFEDHPRAPAREARWNTPAAAGGSLIGCAAALCVGETRGEP